MYRSVVCTEAWPRRNWICERVAVLGIGGLGHLAVQYAKAAGFETIAVSHSPDKDELIRELGADEIVRDGKSLAAAGGADVILSTSNSTKSMVDSIQGLRPDGRLVTMGADAEPLTISLMDLISKRIRIIGSQQNGPEYLYEALDFVAQGKVKTIVETYPLAEAPKAYQRVVDGKARFRAVLTMQSSIRVLTAAFGGITGYFPRTQIREGLPTIRAELPYELE
jgi:alcohol dehydrogenase